MTRRLVNRPPKLPEPTLHERIAKALKWSLEEVNGFPLVTLRNWVRQTDRDVAAEIQKLMDRGDTHFKGQVD